MLECHRSASLSPAERQVVTRLCDRRSGKKNAMTTKHQFWQQHNKPIELWSENVIKQKIEYIHNNPVKSGFVVHPEDWKYASARNFQEDHTVLQIDPMGFFD